jgi:hypothetical protein
VRHGRTWPSAADSDVGITRNKSISGPLRFARNQPRKPFDEADSKPAADRQRCPRGVEFEDRDQPGPHIKGAANV